MALVVKNPPANAGDIRDSGSIPGLGRPPWRRTQHPTPVFLTGESHGQRSLVGFSPSGPEESDVTDRQSTAQHASTRGGNRLREVNLLNIIYLIVSELGLGLERSPCLLIPI